MIKINIESEKRKGEYKYNNSYRVCNDYLIIHASEDTIQDKDDALEELLKDSLRTCRPCHGIGRLPHPIVRINITVNCFYCGGGGCVCAYCRADSEYCKCGSEEKE